MEVFYASRLLKHRTFVRKVAMIYVAIFLLNVMDLILTHLAVNVLQVATEANPIMAPIIDKWIIVPIKLGAALAVVFGLRYCRKMKLGRAVTWFVLVFYILIVLSNSLTLVIELFLL